jgi:hypothetical protein
MYWYLDRAPPPPASGGQVMKAVVVHGLLALFGLMVAFQTWTRVEEDEPSPGEVTAVECDSSTFRSLTLQSEKKKVVVEPKKSAKHQSYWFTVERKKRKKATSEEQAQSKEPESDNKSDKGRRVEQERFLANDDFSDLLKWLVPFRAVRALGKNTRELDKEFDTQKGQTTLTLKCGTEKHSFEVGSTTYGTGARYIKNKATKEVFLIPGNVVRDLNSAKYKFMQKRLHSFELKEVDKARVEAQAETRTLVQRDRHDRKAAVWVDAAQPDRRNELYGNWFSQVAKLTASKYLTAGEQPGSDLEKQIGDVEPLLKIEYSQRDQPLGWIEMVRVNAEQEYYYARTETTETWVALPRSVAKRVAQDVAMVVGTEEQPTQPESSDKAPTRQSKADKTQ